MEAPIGASMLPPRLTHFVAGRDRFLRPPTCTLVGSVSRMRFIEYREVPSRPVVRTIRQFP